MNNTDFTLQLDAFIRSVAVNKTTRFGNKQYLIVKPTIKGIGINGEDLSQEIEKELKRVVLQRQYNRELAKYISSCIDSLNSTASPNVIIIYIPTRWRRWEHYKEFGEKFDLHDYIKAYCVQRGIATQFIREETMKKSQQCQIMWWLSLSFYVKAGRTPWILDSLDNDSIYGVRL